MGFFERFRPKYQFASVEKIDIDWLKTKKIQHIFLDVDNTITGWGEETVPSTVAKWLETVLLEGITVILISNSGNQRLEKIAKRFNIPYISWALKPSKSPFKKALQVTACQDKQTVLVVGDQLFTDIWGGNKLGLNTALVTPRYQRELFYTQIIRQIERKVLKILQI